jgi:hypothetical protein
MLLLRDGPAFEDFADRLRTKMAGFCQHDFQCTRELLAELNREGYRYDIDGTVTHFWTFGCQCDHEVLEMAGVPLEPVQPDEMQEPTGDTRTPTTEDKPEQPKDDASGEELELEDGWSALFPQAREVARGRARQAQDVSFAESARRRNVKSRGQQEPG